MKVQFTLRKSLAQTENIQLFKKKLTLPWALVQKGNSSKYVHQENVQFITKKRVKFV